ncbi:LysR family transcriptional regulator [Streptomyces winkii]|uniref:LysR family transcriptional regulator n=1 Tax=Streptomyces winkii TaxID=3051178 RepID=UPI0028D5AA3D|nr:LysR family transcriptional regulator [Streptomyces sp. DSM 40971]
MDARQLGYFLAVVQHEHFGRAAEQLRIAQPSLSQAMRTLERELGVPLFHRIGRGIVLSDAGSQLVEPARQVLRDLDAAKAAAQSVRGLQRGRVELVSMPSPGMEPLATITSDFTREHPAMSATVEAAFTPEEVIHAVKSGRVELGLLGGASTPSTEGLRVLHVEDQPLVLMSPPGSGQETPSRSGRDEQAQAGTRAAGTVRRRQLDGMRLVVSKRGSLMRRLVDDVLSSGVKAQIVVEVEHRTSVLPMVMAGVGHAVVPSSWTGLAEGAGARVRHIEPVSLLRIFFVTRTTVLTPAAQAFAACVERYAAQLPEGARRATA